MIKTAGVENDTAQIEGIVASAVAIIQKATFAAKMNEGLRKNSGNKDATRAALVKALQYGTPRSLSLAHLEVTFFRRALENALKFKAAAA